MYVVTVGNVKGSRKAVFTLPFLASEPGARCQLRLSFWWGNLISVIPRTLGNYVKYFLSVTGDFCDTAFLLYDWLYSVMRGINTSEVCTVTYSFPHDLWPKCEASP